MLEKTPDVRPREGNGERPAPLRGEAVAGREVVGGERDGQERSLACGSIGPDLGRPEGEDGFVDPDDRPSFVPGFFRGLANWFDRRVAIPHLPAQFRTRSQ